MASVKQLILASKSPFRRQLLTAAGVAFDVQASAVDESRILASTPADLARLRSEAKALAVAEQAPGALVIGADQVLSLDGEAFDKVETPEAARERLSRLQGRVHYLHSGLVLALGRGDSAQARCLSSCVVDIPMRMRPLTEAEIDAYVAAGEWEGSVGCYQFENRGVQLFDGVDSDYAAIVGLPLQPLLAELRRLGINPLVQREGPWELK